MLPWTPGSFPTQGVLSPFQVVNIWYLIDLVAIWLYDDMMSWRWKLLSLAHYSSHAVPFLFDLVVQCLMSIFNIFYIFTANHCFVKSTRSRYGFVLENKCLLYKVPISKSAGQTVSAPLSTCQDDFNTEVSRLFFFNCLLAQEKLRYKQTRDGHADSNADAHFRI